MTKLFYNKSFVRVLSLVLCFVMFGMLFLTPALAPKAHALAPVLVWAGSEGAFAVMLFILSLLGIHFASRGEMMLAINDFFVKHPIILEGIETIVEADLNPVSLVWKARTEAFQFIVATVIPAVREFFARNKTEVSIPDYASLRYKYDDVPLTNNVLSLSAEQLYYLAPFAPSDNVTITDSRGIDYLYTVVVSGRNACQVRVFNKFVPNGEGWVSAGRPPLAPVLPTEYRYGFFLDNIDGLTYLQCYIVARVENVMSYDYYSGVPVEAWVARSLLIDETSLVVEQDTLDVPYGYDIDYSDSELLNAIRKMIDEMIMTGVPERTIPLEQEAGYVEAGRQEAAEAEKDKAIPFVPDWARIWDLLGIKDLIGSIAIADEDAQYKPQVPNIPTIGGTWDYVSTFVTNMLIWMQLWFSGFVLLPAGLKSALWALLVITIVTGLLGVFLQ